jgi:hypothetical protein
MFFATTRRLPTIAKNQNRQPLTRMSAPRSAVSVAVDPEVGSRIEQVLGACMMIGFFLVMALFG